MSERARARSLAVIVGALVCVGGLAGGPRPAQAQAQAPAAAPGATTPSPAAGLAGLGTLPANFGGVLPCADCTGIRQSLDLFPDGAFYWRSTYLGKPATESPDDIGRWLFASDGRTLLLFGGREAPVRFVLRDDGALRLLDLEGRPIQSSFNYELRRAPGAFSAFEARATLRGAYSSSADAPAFTDCGTGRQMPVAPEGAALALERAYVAAQPARAAPRLVVVEGRIAERMPETGTGPRATLVVDKFLRLANAGEACPPPPSNRPLADTHWRLTQLGGTPVPAGARRREAWLQFDAAQGRISGSGGCNSVTGAFTLEGAAVRFSKVAGTMLACGDDVEQERAFVAMLGKAQRWLVAGVLLELEDGEQRLLARFEAAPPGTRPR